MAELVSAGVVDLRWFALFFDAKQANPSVVY